VAPVLLLDFGDQALAWFGLQRGRGLSKGGVGNPPESGLGSHVWEFGEWAVFGAGDTAEPRALVNRDNIKRLSLALVVLLLVTVTSLAFLGVGFVTDTSCCLPYPSGSAA
jgi:hypothetical protein